MPTLKSTSSTNVSLLETAISSADGRSAGSTTVAPNFRSVASASSNTTLTKVSFPEMLSFRNTRRGTPMRAPRRAPAFNAFVKSGTTAGCARVKLSFGSFPAIMDNTMAASVSERVMGPTVSWCSEIGITKSASERAHGVLWESALTSRA